jgi:hypothetical protein
MKRIIFLIVAMSAAAAHAAELFPMHVGDRWIYDAEVEWTLPDNRTMSAIMPWTMEVVDVVQGRRARAVVVRGFLMRLAWLDPTTRKAPQFDVIVMRPDGIWIDEDVESADDARARARSAAGGQVVGHQLLQLPLHEKDCVDKADPESPAGSYCWFLEAAGSTANARSWRVEYRSLPAHEILEFTEGVGFTGYAFGHHGTVASAHAMLRKALPAK